MYSSVAFTGKEAHVFHVGYRTFMAKRKDVRPTKLVRKSIAVDSSIAPSKIQGSSILSAITKRKPWVEIGKVVEKFTNMEAISNEKLKQKRIRKPYGNKYQASEEYNQYSDKKNKFLVYKVDENKQIVFRSSVVKMEIAAKMSLSTHFLSEKFCHFDGKVNRTRHFTTLTASVYHSLLQKQIAFASMDCISENTENVEVFWRLFNQAFKEANKTNDKYYPQGWISDMVSSNFNGLIRLYGEEVLEKIKGCEFHSLNSVNKHSRNRTEEADVFKALAKELLIASTK